MTLHDQLAAAIREAEANPPADYHGADWWQILPAEIFVFDIELARWPRMMTAYMAYEIFLGLVAAEDGELTPAVVEAERQAQAEIFDKGHGVKGFQEFGKLYAGLTFREAAAAYDKVNYWGVRVGETSYSDET